MSGWFDFSGRISRRRFWLAYVLPLAALLLGAMMLDGLMITRGILQPDAALLTDFAALAVAFGMLSACVQRLHDLGCNGGWVLLMAAVPLAGPVLGVLLLGCLPGSALRNRFGPAPV
ncbi:DUF805 domain-containing protein [Pseudoroseomonas wenyumeiae]|uniref:DUF805 domain-containing protein n=1 Tax=Teichococcus wenyumeiae TaxID=2478470 RepID=A0A3A9JDE0_9PROT|nr:DUF805 domain-containing protein [Pseudoroseomonas wenyumeiae]RKK05357.1 DUF805 domain-containing protein [Pseudoroseomonas wenyumeiae]RMI25560.1 DUF805 domain-containing protein [Pseudoroseomonas wenyumeiae]